MWYQFNNLYIISQKTALFVCWKIITQHSIEKSPKEFANRYCNPYDVSFAFEKDIRS